MFTGPDHDRRGTGDTLDITAAIIDDLRGNRLKYKNLIADRAGIAHARDCQSVGPRAQGADVTRVNGVLTSGQQEPYPTPGTNPSRKSPAAQLPASFLQFAPFLGLRPVPFAPYALALFGLLPIPLIEPSLFRRNARAMAFVGRVPCTLHFPATFLRLSFMSRIVRLAPFEAGVPSAARNSTTASVSADCLGHALPYTPASQALLLLPRALSRRFKTLALRLIHVPAEVRRPFVDVPALRFT